MLAKGFGALLLLAVVYLVSWYAVRRANRESVREMQEWARHLNAGVTLWDQERRRLIEYHVDAAHGCASEGDHVMASRHRTRAAFLGRDEG